MWVTSWKYFLLLLHSNLLSYLWINSVNELYRPIILNVFLYKYVPANLHHYQINKTQRIQCCLSIFLVTVNVSRSVFCKLLIYSRLYSNSALYASFGKVIPFNSIFSIYIKLLLY